ncbi:MAG: hypothetical protein LBP87_12175 [Planctomycetaceae bacterium]|jgi:hypothetical protein|nr:hypothetical protein [Planctomycetaceae bacterium]
MNHKKFFQVLIFVLLTISLPIVSAQTVVKEVVRFEQMNENLLQPDQFQPYEKGFEKQGDVFVCDNGNDNTVKRGVLCRVILNQEQPLPIYAEAWSKAENVGSSQSLNHDYCIYLELTYNDATSQFYTDGVPLSTQSILFSAGTHDWEQRQMFLIPEKPVKSLTFYILFKNRTGKAYFRDMKLSTQKIDSETVLFDGIPVRKSVTGKTQPETISFQIRDVAGNSDFVLLDKKPFGIRSKIESNDKSTQITLTNETKENRCLTLVFSRFLNDLEHIQFCRIRKNIPTSENHTREHLNPVSAYGINHIGANGRLSQYPFSAIIGQKKGQEIGCAVGIDLAYPAFFRTGYNEATNELFVAIDLALTKESPETILRFVQFGFTPEYGFRGALDAYQRLFPEFFRNRIEKQGIWMPFAAISKVPQFEDFGFAVKEGNDETAWDDAHNILTFRYTEPMTWWMPLSNETPRTYEAALEHVQKLADKGIPIAKSLFITGMRDANGQFGHHFLNMSWSNGIVWSFNDLPKIANGGFALKWNEKIAEGLYGSETAKKAARNEHVDSIFSRVTTYDAETAELDGEYVDSADSYATILLDFDRNHFAAASRPLVFSRNDYRPAIFRGLIAYEYIRTLSEYLHAHDKYIMGNGADTLCWLAPYLDVSGLEINWNLNKKWSPMSMEGLFYRRALCGPKPFCFLMSSYSVSTWTYEMTEKFMKRSLAFGMFPGFNASVNDGHYYTRPELYERDRPLFKKYIPICKEVAESGWQPVTKVISSNDHVFVERFGNENPMLTVFNDSSEPQTVTLHFDTDLPKHWTNPLDNKKYETQTDTLILTVALEDVVVLKSRSS